MSRPIYQTAQDLTNQEGLIKQAVFRLNPISPPPYTRAADLSPYDYSTEYPPIVFEAKKRRISHSQYETYLISANKVDSLISLGRENGVSAVLVVGWTDAWGWMPLYSVNPEVDTLEAMLSKGEVGVSNWGRTDRNDPYDVERSYEWPIKEFLIYPYVEDLERERFRLEEAAFDAANEERELTE
tara:strand:- start:754 stop:1305 length:552 start_codon:yes stop_codon:yes gene_type:complete